MTRARLRLVFCALALVLALPAALLVRRALASVAMEREARERAVAERAFDEMERSLTELLRSEEVRPAADYDFAREGSPLRERPADGVALGWFQIEADGRVTTPLWAAEVVPLAEAIAADGARMEAIAGAPKPTAAQPKRELREKSGKTAQLPPGVDNARVAPASPSAAPGERPPEPVVAPRADPQAGAEDAVEVVARTAARNGAEPVEQQKGVSAYDALAKLNTGAKEREQRTQRVYVEEPAEAPSEAASSPPAPFGRASSDVPQAGHDPKARAAAAESERVRAQALVDHALRSEPEDSLGAPSGSPTSKRSAPPGVVTSAPIASSAEAPHAPISAGAAADARGESKTDGNEAQPQRRSTSAAVPSPTAQRAAGPASAAPQPEAELVRVVLDPMRGRLAPSGELLLVRSAWIGDRGVRQGLAVDVAQLERMLAAAALGDGALPRAIVHISTSSGRAGGAGSGELRDFTHRFAEPFDALRAQLAFPPFADEGARSVYWLAALFALAGAGSLLAIYRMTAVALHFADRRSSFAAAVSHELKTPLTAIRLYAEMLRDGLVSGEEKRREYYGSITAETERLSRLIDNVLEFSKLEKGTRSLALQVGDVGPVIREAIEMLQPHARERGVALALSLDETLPPVRFERDALTQIVFNLVDNAIKYGRGEPARIEVSCERAGDGVSVAVRDHGAGVPREELARILEPFYRRGDELTRSAQGAGIGLALVKSLADQMGGRFAVANAEQGGLLASVELSGAGA